MDPGTTHLLDRVRAEQARYGEAPQPPASDDDLAALVERARAVLGGAPPEAYLALLRRENGLNHNGLFLYGSEDRPLSSKPDVTLHGLVEANLLWRDAPGLTRYLLFGEGNLDLYGLHLETGAYHVLDRVPGNVIERHGTADALIAAAIRAHL